MGKTAGMALGVILTCGRAAPAGEDAIVLENARVRYVIAPDATNLSFVDRATGIDYLKRDAPSRCAIVRREGKDYSATSVSLAGSRLAIRFGDAPVEAVLAVEPCDLYIRLAVESIRLTVESVTGSEIESLVFLNVPLTLRGRPEEPFGACAFSLNLITRVDQLPALQTELRAACHRRFGIAGAKAAIVAAPMDQMLPALKSVLTESDEMPHCTVAGPWAREVPFNHGSYLFNFGTLTEATAEGWIDAARNLGVTQIDHHGGSSAFFRFGDFALNPEKWPKG